MSNDHSCTHIKVTGVRCDSPALRGEQFCYFHQNAHRGVRRPQQSRLHPIAIIEDEESIQYALMEVINALMRNTIDVKRATLIIRALHIAVKNAARVKFGIHDKDAVTQVPNYAPPTAEQEEIAMESELPAVSAIPYKPVEPTNPHFWEYSEEGARVLAREAQAAKAKPSPSVGTDSEARVAKDCVGTDAFVRPGREATVPPRRRTHECQSRNVRIRRSPTARLQKDSADPSTPTKAAPAFAIFEGWELRSQSHSTQAASPGEPSSEGAQDCSPRRKAWVTSRKEAQAPKGRKKFCGPTHPGRRTAEALSLHGPSFLHGGGAFGRPATLAAFAGRTKTSVPTRTTVDGPPTPR